MESQGLNLSLSTYIYSNTIAKLLKQAKNQIIQKIESGEMQFKKWKEHFVLS